MDENRFFFKYLKTKEQKAFVYIIDLFSDSVEIMIIILMKVE